jgi:SPP1 gp7 family putative phage head morphogenesis protein
MTDPTGTRGIRERFIKQLLRRFRDLRGRIREIVGYDEDRLHLKQDARLQEPEDIERFPTDQGKIRAFTQWLQSYLDDNVLEAVPIQEVAAGSHWTATFVRAAYRTGWTQARARLRSEGVSVGSKPDNPLQLGVAQSTLRGLYTRVFENLQSISEDSTEAVRDELTRSLAEGINPREMARRLTSRVQEIERTQAEVLARTETINAHSKAAVDRYSEANADISGVTVSGEFVTAQDDRVCPICDSIAGEIFDLEQVEGETETFEFEPGDDEQPSLSGEYRIRPPVHPQCRCTLLPQIS